MKLTAPPRLLLVHAHPDDESLWTGGTIARYAATGEGLDQLVWDALLIKKDFIDQQRQIMLMTKLIQHLSLRGTHVRAGRIVRIHQHDGARARGDRFVERREIDLPPVIVDQRIG